MKGKTTLVLACVATASVFSLGAQAAPESDGLQACVSALASKLSGDQGSPVQASINEDTRISSRQLGLATTFSMDAYTPDKSEVVARMDCTVDARGKVLRLVKLKENAPDAKTRSF